MSQQVSSEELAPTSDRIRQLTVDRLSAQLSEEELDDYLSKLGAEAPAPIGATVDVKIAVWGKISVDPDGQPWKYDHTIWGGPAYFGSSVGFMYTAYDSWDAFFQNVSGCHVQGVDVGGGILQVNWFIPNGTPVGQFNGVAAGAGLVEGGGSGKWERR